MSLFLRSAATPGQGIWGRLDQRGRLAALLVVAASVAFTGTQSPTLARALVGGFGLVVFMVIAFSARDTALVMVVVWLVLMGFVRRALIPFAGWADNDPLLLISPAAAITFLLASRGSGARRAHNALSGIAAFLMLWSGLQIFNPNEASLITAAQGAMFWMVPMLWFFVGRTLTDEQHDRIMTAVVWVSAVVVFHGLYQTFFDLLPFEYTWLSSSKQGSAMFVGGFRVRPFSTLTSPQEYGQALAFAIVIVWSRITYLPKGTERRVKGAHVVLLITSAVALFYQSGRMNLVLCVLAFAIITVVRFRSFVLLFLLLVLAVGLSQGVSMQGGDGTLAPAEASADDAGTTAGALAEHTIEGLTNPAGSTLPLHLHLIELAIEDGLRQPFGFGVSEGTIAGARADTNERPSGENDVANALRALGTLPGFAYLAFLGAAFAGAVRVQRQRPSARHLATLGMLICALTSMWIGQLYATSTIIFLALGGLARESGDLIEARQAATLQRLKSLARQAREPVGVGTA
ncbi:MAG TPA: hypothetical protein VI916_01220 [Acidimicrobiia bacterium]|nr:hypothetical protein [Acidimicrobiia bacterium]